MLNYKDVTQKARLADAEAIASNSNSIEDDELRSKKDDLAIAVGDCLQSG